MYLNMKQIFSCWSPEKLGGVGGAEWGSHIIVFEVKNMFCEEQVDSWKPKIVGVWGHHLTWEGHFIIG